jgi:hypothetical protein
MWKMMHEVQALTSNFIMPENTEVYPSENEIAIILMFKDEKEAEKFQKFVSEDVPKFIATLKGLKFDEK